MNYLVKYSTVCQTNAPHLGSQRARDQRQVRTAPTIQQRTSSSQWQVRILTTPQSPEHTFDRHTNTFITKHSFIGLFSRTTWVHQHQKGKTILGFHEARVDKSFRMAVASA